MMGHKLIRIVQLTPMIVVELMTLTVTMMVSVTGLGRGVWSLCHVFVDTLCVIRDLMEDSVVPSNLSVPKVSDSDRAATSARAKKSPKSGEHV